MTHSQFDAAELGLLERDEFKLDVPEQASKVKGDTYLEVRKLGPGKILLTKEQGNTTKYSEHLTLREALRSI